MSGFTVNRLNICGFKGLIQVVVVTKPYSKHVPGNSKWPFYPQTLEVTIHLSKRSRFHHPKKVIYQTPSKLMGSMASSSDGFHWFEVTATSSTQTTYTTSLTTQTFTKSTVTSTETTFPSERQKDRFQRGAKPIDLPKNGYNISHQRGSSENHRLKWVPW